MVASLTTTPSGVTNSATPMPIVAGSRPWTRAFAELNKFGSRELDRFQFVRELWKARERLALRSRAKRTGLCRNRHLGGIAHFAQQRQHYLRSLLAIGAHRNRTEIGHDLGTL